MVITMNEIGGLGVHYLMSFCRVLSFVGVLSLMTRGLGLFKVWLALSMVLAVAVSPVAEGLSNSHVSGLLSGLWMAFLQCLVGACMGFVFVMVFQTFVMVGQLLGIQSGLSFGAAHNNGMNQGVSGLTHLIVLFIGLVFFSLNGHLSFVSLIHDSFECPTVVPPSQRFEIP